MPPVANAALAYAAGIAMADPRALLASAPLVAVAVLLAPIRASWRLKRSWPVWAAIALAGIASGLWVRSLPPCAAGLEEISGRFLAAPGDGPTPFFVEAGEPGTTGATDCELRVFGNNGFGTYLGAGPIGAGHPVTLVGDWNQGRAGPWFKSERVSSADPGSGGLRWTIVRWRASLIERVHSLFGENGALASALILARREGLDPSLRQAFADTGTAHLLAISGFHVGVVFGLCLGMLRAAKLSRRRASVTAALATWAYVGFIGFPDAATRAAAIVALLAVQRSLGRPQARWGALGATGLVLLALDPSRLESVGFQLSFAGAAGLLAWSRPTGRWIDKALGRAIRRPPRFLVSALAAGTTATAATLPIVAWHFEQIAILGIPATLVVTPFVAVAVPGAIAALALDPLAPGLAAALAGGVGLALDAVRLTIEAGASLSWATVWVSSGAVAVAAAGAASGAALARRFRAGRRSRAAMVAAWSLSALLFWPLLMSWSGRGSLHVYLLDVGQGDAIAIRTPRDRWLLVDAGPPGRIGSGPHPVVRELRRLGVRRIETLVLTHPDLDHIGGAVAVLEGFQVGEVLDPAAPVGRPAYLETLRAARRRGVEWRRAVAGERWLVDDVEFKILAPGSEPIAADTEANASSIVLLASLGEFDLLLTGDAPREVERRALPDLARLAASLEVLKVGHHGSATSTDPLLTELLLPELALLSLGRGNRYGHPAADVLSRLSSVGARTYRTDRDGTVTVRGRPDGGYRVRTRR